MKPKRKKPPMSKSVTLFLLRYIANSPDVKRGGFDPKTVEIAKSALYWLKRKKR